jgi:hypothetical protein
LTVQLREYGVQKLGDLVRLPGGEMLGVSTMDVGISNMDGEAVKTMRRVGEFFGRNGIWNVFIQVQGYFQLNK